MSLFKTLSLVALFIVVAIVSFLVQRERLLENIAAKQNVHHGAEQNFVGPLKGTLE